MIKQHIIGPLLNPKNRNAKPKKIYVVGCSLGAAISQIAYCYILEQLYNNLRDPDFKTVDRLISVTAGCPRVGDKKFRDVMTKKMDALRHLGLDRAVICRMVYNNDIVPHAPPNILTFRHLDKLVYITKNGKHIMINPDISKQFSKFNEIKVIYRTIFEIKKANFEVKRDEAKANFDEKKEEVAGAAHERMQSVQVAMHMRPSVATSASNNNSQSEGGDNNDANANTSGSSSAVMHSTTADAQKATALALAEEEIPLRTAFEIECENSLEGIRDHMPYWYMIYLEKLQKEQNSKYSLHDTKNDVSHDLAAIVEEDDGDRDDDAVADAETASITSREKEAPTESSQAIGVVE